ncbi:hypothetical protein C9374_004415 [Naegleria lovaniensis]|uniref:Uncharacterized protein n=1 Tax=Naegleria lovaniensis TaxID=51637 RepID=A0AA88GRB7_NAELO|nr:uncharacterized protein C9374_004415 [Naegleria lovaniensis]KAG2383078.1 hypothetical protein C9374_004415 [Naegleria lovaniensis]
MSFLKVSSSKTPSKAFQLNEAEFEDDPYMAEKVKSLKAAQKLEEQFQNSYQNIAWMRKAIEEEDMKREMIHHQQAQDNKLNDSDEIENEGEELEIVEDDQITDQLEFTLDDIPFPANTGVPIHERLLNFGSSLSLKLEMMKKAKEEKESESAAPQITDIAKQIKRKGSVENRLIQSRDELNARIEELRLKKEKQELEELRGPKINKRSKLLKREEPTIERLLGYREQTLAKREMIKHQIEEKQQQEITSKPQINKKSQKLRRTLDAMSQWEKERNLKTEQLRNEIKKQEAERLQNPKINPISEKLVSQMDRGQDIGEYLIQRYEQKKLEKEMKKRMEKEKESIEAKPQISIHSANLERQGVVFDRLYQDSLEKENKRREQIAQIENQINHGIDPNTGLPLHNPVINPRSALMEREEPVEEILLKKKEESERKKMALVEREQKVLEAHGSKVGAYSQLLVELLERRTQTSTMDRLTRQPKKQEPSIAQTYSFKPHINQTSREMDKSKNHGTPRQEVLLRKGFEYEMHKKEIEQKIKEEEEESFSPVVSTKSKSMKTPKGSVIDRSADWIRKKEQKMESERRLKEYKEAEACTFKPNVKRLDVSHIAPCESHFKTKEEESSYAAALKNREQLKQKATTPRQESKKPRVKDDNKYANETKKESCSNPSTVSSNSNTQSQTWAQQRPKSRGSTYSAKLAKDSSGHPVEPVKDAPQPQRLTYQQEKQPNHRNQQHHPSSAPSQNHRYDELEESEIYDTNEIVYEDVDPELEFEELKRLVEKDKGKIKSQISKALHVETSNNKSHRLPESPSIRDLLDSQSTLSELYRLSNEKESLKEVERNIPSSLTPQAYQLITDMIRKSKKG